MTDVVVIGLGPGGEDVAGRLAEAGLSVVGVENELVGGECPYWACVPSKMMIRASDLLAEGRRIAGAAGTATVTPDFTPVAGRIRDEATDDWNDAVAADRLTGKGATLLRGRGRLSGPGEVTVEGRDGVTTVVRARRAVVVATGTRAVLPPIEGLAGLPVWTNREATSAKEVPPSLIVLGGGPVGAELAQAFARFGAHVTIVEGAPRLLAREEPAAGDLIAEVFEREGIAVRAGVTVTGAAYDGADFTLTLADGEQLTAAQVLVATGRATHLDALGVETVGLDRDIRFFDVDDRMRVTGADNLYAIGDVAGEGAFTHMAIYQSDIAVRDILGQGGPGADYAGLSRVTFTDPEVGSVGLTEAQARAAGLRVRVGRTSVADSTRGWIHGPGNDGFIQVVEDAERGVLVGATSVGPAGGEVLGLLVLAVHARVPVATLRSMIYAYPTFHRAIQSALADLEE